MVGVIIIVVVLGVMFSVRSFRDFLVEVFSWI